MEQITAILMGEDKEKKLALFRFTVNDSDALIALKFNLYGRYFFPKYFKSEDAPFHADMDREHIRAYKADIKSYLDAAFRGAAKTTRLKLFCGFAILCDKENFRKYMKVLSEDDKNSKQFVTDVYNMLVHPEIVSFYPDTFKRSNAKREEQMGSFTTYTGVKMIAGTVGTAQRGQVQEDVRPDFIIFDDFENRKTLRSAVMTKSIWDNMEEAKQGLAKGGSCIYKCNYLSELGNVHKLVLKADDANIVSIVPIIKDGVPTWNRYTVDEIIQIRKDADDFEGEYLCQPSASKDILFDRATLDSMHDAIPWKVLADFKMFKEYNPSHRYGSGHDISGGVGLDSSTSVFIDFTLSPAQVVATYKTNTMPPDIFGDEIKRQSDLYGGCITAPEQNNHGHATIARLKQLEVKMYMKQAKATKMAYASPAEFGWHTNQSTKPSMLFDLKKAIEDGLLLLNDKDLIAEAKSYSRYDLLEREGKDPTLKTRHFDLLIACAIAWQMKNWAEVKVDINDPSYNSRRTPKKKTNFAR